MKKVLFFALLMVLGCVSAFGQANEPEFIGEVNLVTDDGKATLLDKEAIQIKTKAGASLYIVGIGSVKSRITIKSPKAAARVKDGEPFNLIVRGDDNDSDPMAVIDLFQFEVKGKQRRAEMSKSNTFGGTSEGNMKRVKFTAKRYGKSSYILTMPSIGPGEYGVIVRNPNNRDEKSVIVACFGVDE